MSLIVKLFYIDMKKVDKKLSLNEQKNNNKLIQQEINELLFLHFQLVKNDVYDTYMSFLKKNFLDDFSELLDKMFVNKEKSKNEKDDIKWN